ncbi:hypothetical protein QUF72_19575 [Desulfobacterales bacterium HSG2]|nr:hypothetical protein [Desulfobacterales bacterium HSG2]
MSMGNSIGGDLAIPRTWKSTMSMGSSIGGDLAIPRTWKSIMEPPMSMGTAVRRGIYQSPASMGVVWEFVNPAIMGTTAWESPTNMVSDIGHAFALQASSLVSLSDEAMESRICVSASMFFSR